jgi:hypothetical protein
VTVETFRPEITAALRIYDRHIVCLEKGQDECAATIDSLVEKAINAYEKRGPGLRHGIALDKFLTVIISQTEGERPLCGIYFNLCSPYRKTLVRKAAKAAG